MSTTFTQISLKKIILSYFSLEKFHKGHWSSFLFPLIFFGKSFKIIFSEKVILTSILVIQTGIKCFYTDHKKFVKMKIGKRRFREKEQSKHIYESLILDAHL